MAITVTVRDGKLCLARPNNCDPNQLWQKDESSKCGFMLVHKASNKVVKHASMHDPLELVNNPCNCPDKSVLWAESGDIISGYKFIRTQSNLGMVLDAQSAVIADGTKIIIYPEKSVPNAGNQLWKLINGKDVTHSTYRL